MFDLDKSIAEWRRQMRTAGIKSPVPLEELESHLRDDIERQLSAGTSAAEAFAMAAQRIGCAPVLQAEFNKVGARQKRMKHALLALAGVSNHSLTEPANTSSSNLEPRWATYLRAAAFLVPAVFLWAFSAVFVVPKLQALCRDTNLPERTAGLFWDLTGMSIRAALFFREHAVVVAGAIVVMLVLLEWRAARWPHYRRAAVGAGIFIFNSVVLFSFFMMFLAALVAVPALTHHVK